MSDRSEFFNTLRECIVEQEQFILTRGSVSDANRHLLNIGLEIPLLAASIITGSLFAGTIATALLVWDLVWFDRHVAVFCPPYGPREATQKLDRVTEVDRDD